MMKRLLVFLLCLLLPFGHTYAQGEADDTYARVQTLIDGIYAYQLKRSGAENIQAWIDGQLSQNAGAGSEWMIFALAQSGTYDFSTYCTALMKNVESAGVLSASTRQKYALALLAAGGEKAYAQTTVQETIGAQGIMSWIYGLHLLTNGCSGSVSAEQAVDELLALQLADGGWALRGDVSDVDVTAMTMQALAAYADTEKVMDALERAVLLLSERQLETGDFVTYGAPNPESAAQVLVALSALGMNALEDERFIKNDSNLLDVMLRYRLEDGSFCHVAGGAANANATVQTLHGLLAWQRMMDGRGSLYHIEADRAAQQMKTSLSYKAVAAIVICAAALAVCVLLLALGKRNIKNFAAVVAAAVALIAFITTTDFQSADSYYTGTTVVKENPIGQVTMSIRCDKALGKIELELPADGVILDETVFVIAQGDTAFSILTEAAQTFGIRLDSSGAQGMKYIAGINALYEYACGDLSGWVYLVNGERASIGCDQYALKDGDVIEWRYTCEMGNDL